MVDINEINPVKNENLSNQNVAGDKLTHINDKGQAHMVDVGDKPVTKRIATASAILKTRADVIQKINEGTVVKGDVLATARIAGIMAAKKTHELIPLCHPLPIDAIQINLELTDSDIKITASVASTGKTGVEMEVLTAVTVAALTVYDMCKAVDRAMTIVNIQLEQKSGGKSGNYFRNPIT